VAGRESVRVLSPQCDGKELFISSQFIDPIITAANSLLIAEKIPGAWLIQINGAGHGLMYQYPQRFSNIVKTFLEDG
jgi:pimeloyl-ACP methyl ester carboxylesterase